MGRVRLENDWIISGLKMWHYCCFKGEMVLQVFAYLAFLKLLRRIYKGCGAGLTKRWQSGALKGG